ncbi:MAG TPA: type II toxin-antitoxin system RatA family toxin [Beijerinckiaceae bacterium]|nr:type II toxin-antitoxin system RatA family toxin [Beijerinckiaceae bacterium]
MPHFSTTRRVPHTATAMLELVADVERYPEFLPYCQELEVLRRVDAPDGRHILTARMTIGYKMIHESFTSRVTVDRARRRILVEYIDGPFRHLENRWLFEDSGEGGSKVDFSIDYSFRSRAFEILAGAVFDKLFRKMAESFEERADALERSRRAQA